MPNIASILKEEIVRLARREIRNEIERLKKSAAQHRSDIVGLKRRVTELEGQVTRLGKETSQKQAVKADGEGVGAVRFSAKGFAKHRERLGLSASNLGLLLDVSAQSIYHWESGKSNPRNYQLAAIAALRKKGKRAVNAELAKLKARAD